VTIGRQSLDATRPDPVGLRRRRASRGRGAWRAHAPLILAALATLFPFYVMVVLSLRKGEQLTLPEALVPFDLNVSAYTDMLARAELVRWVVNTAVYSGVSVVLVLLFASCAAYAFAKKRFFGREVLFWTLLATIMVPYHLTLIPQFILISRLNGIDTYWGLIVPTLANTQALFLMRQFISKIPDELIEAARIDGAGEFRVFFGIVLPQTKPILATLGVFVFLWHWNDFLWPLVQSRSPDHYVLTVGLNSVQAQNTSLSVTMAAAVCTFLPILLVYLVLQRHFVRGVVTSGLK
jgi:multiple sugar transport system permease protein